MDELKEILKKYEITIKELESNYECLKGKLTCMKDEDIRRALLGIISRLDESQLDIIKMSVSINSDIQEEMFEIIRILDKDRRNCITWINLALMMGNLGDVKLNNLWPALIQGSGLGDILVKLRMIFIMMDKYSTNVEKIE